MKESLGIIEVKGLVASIQVADTMSKVAAVNLRQSIRAQGFGWITICITGDVAAVEAAIQAGRAISEQNNWFVSAKVIPRPAEELESVFDKQVDQVSQKMTDKEKPIKLTATEEVAVEPKEELAKPTVKKDTGSESLVSESKKPAKNKKK